jgi:hypothetical protein
VCLFGRWRVEFWLLAGPFPQYQQQSSPAANSGARQAEFMPDHLTKSFFDNRCFQIARGLILKNHFEFVTLSE